MRVGERFERMMQRQRDHPRGERLRQALEPRNHLLQEVAIVQSPADLLGELEVGLEEALLESVCRMHDAPVPETGLERHRRQRRIAAFGEHRRQRDVVIAGKPEGDGAVIEGQQRRHRRELGVRGPPFARFVGDIGEAQGVGRPAAKMRHHLLAADAIIHREVLQRFDLHDDEILSAGRAERRAAGAQRRAGTKPFGGLAQLRVGHRRPQPRRARERPGVVRVIAERAELLDDRPSAERLIERRRGQHTAR